MTISATTPGLPHGPLSGTTMAGDKWDSVARYALLASIFLSGWFLLRVGSVNFTFSDAALLICLIITAARGRLGATPFGSLTPFWVTGLAMMLGGLFVGSIMNGDPLRWVNIALQYTVSFMLIPMVLMQQDDQVRRIGPLLFMLGIVLSQIIGITVTLLFTPSDTLPLLGTGFYTGNQRLGSLSGEPNSNGAVISFAMPMLLYAVRQRQISLYLALGCLLALVWGLLLTASFTGFAATLLTVFICLLLLGGFRYIAGLAIVMGAAFGLFIASGTPLPKAFQERVGNAVESGDLTQAGTFTGRSELIKEAWTFTEQYSVIGMGVDRYRELSAHDNPVHNLYLLIWNEGGIVAFTGLILLLSLLCLMAAGGLRDRERGAPTIAVLLVFLIYTLSYPHMYSRMWVMPVMIMLALLYGPRRASDTGRAHLIYSTPAGPPQMPSF